MTLKLGRRPRLPAGAVGAVGACQDCGDLHVLTLEGLVWKHRLWTKDQHGVLIRLICFGSGLEPRSPR